MKNKLVVWLGLILTSFFLGAVSVSALSLEPPPSFPLPPDYGGGMPIGHLLNCDSGSQSPAFVSWGWKDDPASARVNVPYGATNVPLNFTSSGVVCRTNSGVYETRFRVNTAVSYDGGTTDAFGSVTNLVGDVNALNFQTDGHQNVGNYEAATSAFNFNYSSGITTSRVVHIVIEYQVINRFSNGVYGCVPSPGGNQGGFNFGSCDTTPFDIWLELVPGPPPNDPPSGNISLSCTVTSGTMNATIFVRKGTVSDPNSDSMTLDVNIGSTNSSPDQPSLTNSTSDSTNLASFAVTRGSDYTVSGTVTDSRGASHNVTGTINCPGPSNPSVTIGTRNCSTLTYQISDTEGFVYSAQLYVDGVARTESSFNQSNRATGSDYTFDIGSWSDFSSHSFQVRVVNTSNSAYAANSTSVSIGPCLRVACSSASSSPNPVERNTQFRVNATYSIVSTETGVATRMGSRGTPRNYTISFSFSGLGGFTGGPANPAVSGTFNSSSGTSIVANNIGPYTAPNSVGVYTITYILGGELSQTCSQPNSRVSNMPYFKVYESDVSVGGVFGLSDASLACSLGQVLASPRSQGSAHATATDESAPRGASVEFALRARGEVIGMFSNSTAATSYTNLTFANTGIASTTWGGNYGTADCIANFWREAQRVSNTAWQNTNSQPINSGAPGTLSTSFYRPQTGNSVTIVGTPNIRGRQAVYVDGDVYISGDITAVDSGWGSPAQIPVTYIVAKGNIYIASSVSRIDAVLVAIPRDVDSNATADTQTGAIFTCRNAASYVATAHPGYAACNRQLLINGALIANEVHFGRTIGTLSQSTFNEAPTSANIAEVIYMSPEYFVATPPQEPIYGSRYKTDSAEVLPPVF